MMTIEEAHAANEADVAGTGPADTADGTDDAEGGATSLSPEEQARYDYFTTMVEELYADKSWRAEIGLDGSERSETSMGGGTANVEDYIELPESKFDDVRAMITYTHSGNDYEHSVTYEDGDGFAFTYDGVEQAYEILREVKESEVNATLVADAHAIHAALTEYSNTYDILGSVDEEAGKVVISVNPFFLDEGQEEPPSVEVDATRAWTGPAGTSRMNGAVSGSWQDPDSGDTVTHDGTAWAYVKSFPIT